MAGRKDAQPTPVKAFLAAAACTVVALVALAACAPGAPGGATQPRAHHNETAVLHQLVECIRAHGVPGFPDGSVDSHGVVSFPNSAPRIPDSAVNACRVYFNQLPPQPTSSPPVPQPLFQELLSFARCMRSHGVSDWPDPAPSGTFFLDPRLIAAGKRGIYRQLITCERANPGISGHFSVAQGR